jgi:ABC-type transport system substrate-binding protein
MPRDGGTFTMAQDAPDRLDPACVDDVYEATIVNQIFDGLLTFDTHLNTMPCVASSWVISPDGTVYTFHLRPGVRFHDGSLVTADDVVYSLTRVFDLPEDQSSLAREYLCHILGSQEYDDGRAAAIRGLEALSPDVVRITLRQPYASFLAVLASEPARIVPKNYVERVGNDEFARRPIGCGPFRFAAWVPDRVVLTRVRTYAAAPARLDSLVFELPQQNARDYAASHFLSGELSAAVVPDGRLSEFQNHPGVTLLTRQELSMTFLGLNAKLAPFDDVRVRQAFALAIDRDALIQTDPSGRIPPNGILPPGMPGYTPESKLLPFDPERARTLLSEAGHPGGAGLKPVVYTAANQTRQAQALFETLRAQVAAVGFDLRIESLGWREFSQRLSTQRLQCFSVTWVADIPDPDSFLYPMCHSAGSANFSGYSDPEVDRLLLTGRGTRSSLERLDVYRGAERRILQAAAVVPLFHPLSAIAIQNDVRGLNVTAMGVGNLPMERVWLASSRKEEAVATAAATGPAIAASPAPLTAASTAPASAPGGSLSGRMP